MGTADKATRIPQSARLPAPEQFTGLTVLLAEDNQTNRLVIRKLLQDYPISLITAHDGRQAVDKTKSYRPDVVLMDMSMPEIDGLQATKEIRALALPQPRIIALTANAFDTDREACLSAGMDDFLSKPVRKADLLTRLLPETDAAD
jgi:CheY-like chemotaxis protein